MCNVSYQYNIIGTLHVILAQVCYRRNGHNEADEPSFTQPLMYKRIKETPNVLAKYTSQLLEEKSVTQDDVDVRERGRFSHGVSIVPH